MGTRHSVLEAEFWLSYVTVTLKPLAALCVLVNYKFSYSYRYNERYRYMDGDTFVTLKALMLMRINYARQSN